VLLGVGGLLLVVQMGADYTSVDDISLDFPILGIVKCCG
jgi:hypothetical protein